MRRCIKCKVPFEGFLGRVSKKIFKVKPSAANPDVCNKCEDTQMSPDSPGKYHCQICNREIDEKVALTHIKSEEYLINLIRKDHPDWDTDKDTCHHCVEYYRRLVKEAEI
jgi:ribosomal protein L37AE/L43A